MTQNPQLVSISVEATVQHEGAPLSKPFVHCHVSFPIVHNDGGGGGNGGGRRRTKGTTVGLMLMLQTVKS